MYSAFSNESFKAAIVQPRTVAVLRMCRKMIFNEFGIKLSLTQNDLIAEITAYAKQSQSSALRQLASELERTFL